jgi:hypothetical protein
MIVGEQSFIEGEAIQAFGPALVRLGRADDTNKFFLAASILTGGAPPPTHCPRKGGRLRRRMSIISPFRISSPVTEKMNENQ